MPPRARVEPTDDWHQIALLVREPGQSSYELIRPVVLYGQPPAERAAEAGLSECTVYRQVARFDPLGLAGLVPPPKVKKHRSLPAGIRQAILDAKREHASLTVHELATNCWARFGRVFDRAGYARFRRWRVSAEHLTLVYQDEPLVQYRVATRRANDGCRA